MRSFTIWFQAAYLLCHRGPSDSLSDIRMLLKESLGGLSFGDIWQQHRPR